MMEFPVLLRMVVVQWVGPGSFKQDVMCSIPSGSRWYQEGHPTSNAPVLPQYTVRIPVLIVIST